MQISLKFEAVHAAAGEESETVKSLLYVLGFAELVVMAVLAGSQTAAPQQAFVGDGQHRHIYIEQTISVMQTDIAINRELWRTHDTQHIATDVSAILTPTTPTATPTRTPTPLPPTATLAGQFATPTLEDSSGLTRTPLTDAPSQTFTPTLQVTAIPTALPVQTIGENVSDVGVRVRSCHEISSACIVIAVIPAFNPEKPSNHKVALDISQQYDDGKYLWVQLWNHDGWLTVGFSDSSQRWIVWE